MWGAAAAPVASRGALPTVVLALLAAPRGLVAGLVACCEPVAGLVAVRYISVEQPFRLSWQAEAMRVVRCASVEPCRLS